MNPYLVRLRTQHEQLRGSIETMLTAAATDGENGRDLTEAELRSIELMAEQAEALVPKIEQLTVMETRSRHVAALAAQVAEDTATPPAGQTRTAAPAAAAAATTTAAAPAAETGTERLGSATTAVDRDPGHYRSVRDGGRHSFFGDAYRAQQDREGEAAQRLAEHTRALATGVAGAGLVPPNWLIEEYESIARQGRQLANVVRQVPIDNPAPMTLPGQTAGTDAIVAEQATENTAVGGADAYLSGVVTVTPRPTAGQQTVSRQMLDMSNPAIDLIIYGDLVAVYDQKVETKVGAALVAAAGAATATFATNAAFLGTPPATPGLDGITDAAVAVRNLRKLPANIISMGVARWGVLKKMKDTAGRPLIPSARYGPQNVYGLGEVAVDGEYDGMALIASDGISTGSFPESIVVFRAQDTILFEGSMMRFRFEEVVGPESVKMGIWAYTAVIVRQAASSVRRVVITAA